MHTLVSSSMRPPDLMHHYLFSCSKVKIHTFFSYLQQDFDSCSNTRIFMFPLWKKRCFATLELKMSKFTKWLFSFKMTTSLQMKFFGIIKFVHVPFYQYIPVGWMLKKHAYIQRRDLDWVWCSFYYSFFYSALEFSFDFTSAILQELFRYQKRF